MGNLCSTNSGASQLGTAGGITELDLPNIISQIKSHFNQQPKSDFIHISLNKTLLRLALESNGSLISKAGNAN